MCVCDIRINHWREFLDYPKILDKLYSSWLIIHCLWRMQIWMSCIDYPLSLTYENLNILHWLSVVPGVWKFEYIVLIILCPWHMEILIYCIDHPLSLTFENLNISESHWLSTLPGDWKFEYIVLIIHCPWHMKNWIYCLDYPLSLAIENLNILQWLSYVPGIWRFEYISLIIHYPWRMKIWIYCIDYLCCPWRLKIWIYCIHYPLFMTCENLNILHYLSVVPGDWKFENIALIIHSPWLLKIWIYCAAGQVKFDYPILYDPIILYSHYFLGRRWFKIIKKNKVHRNTKAQLKTL